MHILSQKDREQYVFMGWVYLYREFRQEDHWYNKIVKRHNFRDGHH